jgi:hypothetical protein
MQGVLHVGDRRDRLAVEALEHVARSQPGAGGRRTRCNLQIVRRSRRRAASLWADETLHDTKSKQLRLKLPDTSEVSMLIFQLIGAAFLLLCLAPLLARDPGARRSSR